MPSSRRHIAVVGAGALPIVREEGFQVDQLDPSDALKRFPQINPGPGSIILFRT
jgi:hypothetical protein